ncbi:cAMP specific phosphodiesterase, partial [Trypanosoma grayi]|uniref:cAMP specific phosphodiesterase n=1 Tax=Trypanosoma grayi TaxID=71804 RepID=UPI0004F47E91
MGETGGRHLLEALTLCEVILARYKRCSFPVDETEITAFRALNERFQDLLPNAAGEHAANTRRVKGVDVAPSFPAIGAAFQTPTDSVTKLMERCIDLRLPIKDVLTVLNDQLSALLRASYTRTYYLDPGDMLLLDPVNGVAAPVDESTPLGKAVSSSERFTIAGTLYIPLCHGGKVMGCVESPAGRADYHSQPLLESVLRVAATALHNAIEAETLNWNKEKAEAMLMMATQLARDNLDEAVLAN